MGDRHQRYRAPRPEAVAPACGTFQLELRASVQEFQPDGVPYELPHPMTTAKAPNLLWSGR